VFTDAEGMTVITRFDGRMETLGYLSDQTSAAAYHMLAKPRVLILGAGGGSDVLQALYHKAASIDALELNPRMVELVRDVYGEYAGEIYRHPSVKIHIADARGYLAASKTAHDLIQVSLVDSFTSSGAGTHALSENYLYTVEALQEYFSHLNEQGLIAITRWLKLPPRDSLKLFATAIKALRESGVSQPDRQLALVRSWQTSTLLIKKGHFTPTDIDRLRNFSEQRSFDVAYIPGIKRSEANRYNILDQAYFYQGSTALLGAESQAYLEDYKFNLRPATDDRPYYFHFFKWRLFPELFALRKQGSLVLLDYGYLILTATLIQAIPISSVLILIPLFALRRSDVSSARRWPAGLYFLSLGLAFLFIEIAFIQRFVLFVSHPLYAAAIALSGFLVFAGMGSAYSTRLEQWARRFNKSAVDLAVAGIVAISFIHLLLLPPLLSAAMTLSMPLKAFIAISSIAPLAFCMGIPFPLGLIRLARQNPEFIPWAWGVNGCASVLSALLATLIAIHFGFQTVIVLAMMLYGFATMIWR
jgi:spermidine synthase